jgi:hypothetical protein
MVRFQVLTAVSMKTTVFWDVALCSLVEVYRRFGGPCCLIALLMETGSASEMSVNFYHSTWCNMPKDSHLQGISCFSLDISRTIVLVSWFY